MKKKIDLQSYLLRIYNLIGSQIRQPAANHIPRWGWKMSNGYYIKDETLKPNVDTHVRSHISSEPL